jgi:hypothetical protein
MLTIGQPNANYDRVVSFYVNLTQLKPLAFLQQNLVMLSPKIAALVSSLPTDHSFKTSAQSLRQMALLSLTPETSVTSNHSTSSVNSPVLLSLTRQSSHFRYIVICALLCPNELLKSNSKLADKVKEAVSNYGSSLSLVRSEVNLVNFRMFC